MSVRFALVAVLALALAPSALAATPGFNRTPKLEPAAAFVAGKPVRVFCGPMVASGHVELIGADEMKLETTGCKILLRRLSGKPIGGDYKVAYDYDLAWSLLALAHEAIHLQGVADETVTDCKALRRLPGMASRFFGYKTWRSRHDLMALAWKAHFDKPDAYTGPCPTSA